MCEVVRFPLEMQPARPFPDGRHQSVSETAVDALAYQPPTDEEWELMSVTNGIANAIEKYGAQRVMCWVRNLAAIQGQEVK